MSRVPDPPADLCEHDFRQAPSRISATFDDVEWIVYEKPVRRPREILRRFFTWTEAWIFGVVLVETLDGRTIESGRASGLRI